MDNGIYTKMKKKQILLLSFFQTSTAIDVVVQGVKGWPRRAGMMKMEKKR